MQAFKKPRLGFIGLGLMGTAMTQRLLEQGWPVTVWNLEPERIAPLVAAGAVAAASPAAVTQASDIVIMCVLHTQAVEECVLGAEGIARSASADKILVDTSSIDPRRTRELAADLRRNTGMRWVDAPVSGGPVAARSGTLAMMAGGEAADVDAVRPLMTDLAANFTHMGPSGSGQTAKMINQLIVGTGYLVLAEALTLAEAAGLKAEALPQCLAGGHADSVLLQQQYPPMQARSFDPPRGYSRQLLKDLKAVSAYADEFKLALPMLAEATRRYEDYVDQGNGMTDTTSIVNTYRRRD